MHRLLYASALLSIVLVSSGSAQVPDSPGEVADSRGAISGGGGAGRDHVRFVPPHLRQTHATAKSAYEAPLYPNPYNEYQAAPTPSFALEHAPGLALSKLFGGKVPTFNQLASKLMFFGGAASVAMLVLMVLSTLFNFIGWKVPVVASIKESVMEHVNKLDARELDDGWNLLLEALNKYSGIDATTS